MGFLDRLSGRKPRGEEPAASVEATPSPAPEPAVSLPSTSPAHDALRDVQPNATLLGAAGLSAPQGKLYNPYEGLSTQAIGTKPHLFRLPEQPEFVFEEEASVRRRDWTQHLQFYCGGGYLAGECWEAWLHTVDADVSAGSDDSPAITQVASLEWGPACTSLS